MANLRFLIHCRDSNCSDISTQRMSMETMKLLFQYHSERIYIIVALNPEHVRQILLI